MKKVFSILGTTLFVFFMVIMAVIILSPMMGYPSFVVVSGSMEPDIKVGSIIFTKRINPDRVYDEIKVNDDISIQIDPNTVLTHRVVSIDRAKDEIVTKGIANVLHDSPISSSRVIGKVVFVLPFAGYIVALIRNPAFLFIVAVIIIGVFIFYKIKEMLNKSK